MNKFCNKCGTENGEQSRFCRKCGNSLQSEKSEVLARERTPADQAAELKEKTKHIWGSATTNEKVIFIGAVGIFVSFFLPWASGGGQSINGISAGGSAWYVYLMPLSALVSCVLLYFSQGATKEKKILSARWQIVIGTFWASLSLTALVAAISIMTAIQNSLVGSLVSSGMGVDIGIGAYLLVAGSIAVIVGAFRLQKELL